MPHFEQWGKSYTSLMYLVDRLNDGGNFVCEYLVSCSYGRFLRDIILCAVSVWTKNTKALQKYFILLSRSLPPLLLDVTFRFWQFCFWIFAYYRLQNLSTCKKINSLLLNPRLCCVSVFVSIFTDFDKSRIFYIPLYAFFVYSPFCRIQSWLLVYVKTSNYLLWYTNKRRRLKDCTKIARITT